MDAQVSSFLFIVPRPPAWSAGLFHMASQFVSHRERSDRPISCSSIRLVYPVGPCELRLGRVRLSRSDRELALDLFDLESFFLFP